MVEKWYYELENKYPDKRCHEMVVMPNHVHFIIENVAMDNTNRDGRVPTFDDDTNRDAHDETGDDGPVMDAHVGAPLRGRPVPATNERGRPVTETTDNHITSPYGPDNKKYGATIGDAMDWFKTMTTNEYIRGVKTLEWPPFYKKLWQRNYYEHIIRNQQAYERISVYIKNNPEKWLDDKFYQK